MLFPKIL